MWAAAFLFFLTICGSARAEGPAVVPAPVPTVEPAPSASEGEENFSAFDFKVGGDYYGYIYGRFGDDWFQADHPEDFIAALPEVRDREAFRPLFDGRLPRERTVPGVGTVKVDVNKFTIEVEIAREQTFLTKVSDPEALPPTETLFTVRNHLFAVGSTATENLDFTENLSFSHETYFFKDRNALKLGGTMNQESGYLLKEAAGRHDFAAKGREWRAEGGLLEEETSLRFARSLGYSGLRLETNQESMFRNEQAQATNIEIFLPRRSQVEIYRNSQADGELMFSRIMDFGTVQIDTRQFRQGSYDIEIVVTDDSGAVTRERRPFTKTSALVPWGHPLMGVEAGTIRQGIDTSGEAFAAASYRLRLKDWLDGSIAVGGTRDDQVGEGVLRARLPLTLFSAPGALNTTLTAAVSGQGKPAGIESAWDWSASWGTARLTASKTYDRSSEVETDAKGSLALSDRQAVSLNLTSPFRLGNRELKSTFSGEINSTKDGGRHYFYGPSFSYAFDRIGDYRPEVRFDYVVTDTDKVAFAALRIANDVGGVWSRSLDLSTRRSKEETRGSAVGRFGFSGERSDYVDWRRNTEASFSLRADPLVSTKNPAAEFVGVNAKYGAKYVTVRGQVDQNIRESTGTATGELTSTLLWNRLAGVHAMSAGSYGPESSLLFLSLKGWPGAKVAIYVNTEVETYAAAGDTAIVPLPAYEKARVSVVPKDESDVYLIRNGTFEIVGFPGNSLYRETQIIRSFFLSGVLLDEAGKPLANERFIFENQALYTDDEGLFTVETPLAAGAENRIRAGEQECLFVIPLLPQDEVLVDVGNISCKKP